MAADEYKGELIFLHKVKDGAVDDSYGIQVAKLANLPDEVINRAQVILDAFEQSQNASDNESILTLLFLKIQPQWKGLQIMTHKMQITMIKVSNNKVYK